MNLQVLEALGIEKAFAMGTSQGGFIVVRMALLDPDKVCQPLFLTSRVHARVNDKPDRGHHSTGYRHG